MGGVLITFSRADFSEPSLLYPLSCADPLEATNRKNKMNPRFPGTESTPNSPTSSRFPGWIYTSRLCSSHRRWVRRSTGFLRVFPSRDPEKEALARDPGEGSVALACASLWRLRAPSHRLLRPPGQAPGDKSSGKSAHGGGSHKAYPGPLATLTVLQ